MGDIITYKQNVYNYLKQFGTPLDSFPIQGGIQDLNKDFKTDVPFIAYSLFVENWDTDGLLQLRIYDKNDSTSRIYDIANKIWLNVFEGCIFNDIIIHKGSPFVQGEPQEDVTIKCLLVNLQINFM